MTFEAFPVFKVPELWRRYKLIINIGIVKKNNGRHEICGLGPQVHTKMVKKAAERTLLKFFFLAIGQSNPPLFSCRVSNDHYEIKLHIQS